MHQEGLCQHPYTILPMTFVLFCYYKGRTHLSGSFSLPDVDPYVHSVKSDFHLIKIKPKFISLLI